MKNKVRSKAPLRLGFAGGGTDVPPYADNYGGYVLNATIDRYSYCTISASSKTTPKTTFTATDIDEYNEFNGTYLNKECRLMVGVHNWFLNNYPEYTENIEVNTFSDVVGGSGLGSSSTMVVAIITAYNEFFNLSLGEYEIAELAWKIERIDLNLKGGKQDQFCAAFGGFNFMEFYKDKTIINPLRIKNDFLNELSASLIIAYTGKSRDSGDVISKQINDMKEKKYLEALHQLKDSALDMKIAVLKGSVTDFANVLNKSWEEKKRTSDSISNEYVDSIYRTAIENGALAGKLSGAGASGFMMFVVRPENKIKVRKALKEKGILSENINFSKTGAESWLVR